jgi:hypothetical protein
VLATSEVPSGLNSTDLLLLFLLVQEGSSYMWLPLVATGVEVEDSSATAGPDSCYNADTNSSALSHSSIGSTSTSTCSSPSSNVSVICPANLAAASLG